MTRNEAIELLKQYNKYLNEDKMGSLLSNKTPIDRFLDSKWAKENIKFPPISKKTQALAYLKHINELGFGLSKTK